jgi:NAD(P)-dependent dehydrogenase (short-subunit alcohol dehydrogenase family)
LAQEGADVVVNDVAPNPYSGRSSDWNGVIDVVRQIEDMGRESMHVIADVSDSGQVDEMFRQIIERFGRLDILINNAGSRPGPDRVPVVELEEDVFDTVQRVNVKGTFLCSRAGAREMIRQGRGGKIISMSSGMGKKGRARYAAYCASKFAIVGFTQALAHELAQYRINVNAICPGLVDTERVEYIAEAFTPAGASVAEHHAEMLNARSQDIPLGRVAQSSDIARMAAFLASGESDYMTGLAVSVSGGGEMG